MTDDTKTLSGSIDVKATDAPQYHERQHPAETYLAGAPFAKVLIQCINRSKAGNHMNQEVVWTDVFHSSNAETEQEWNFTASVANTTTWSEEKVAEVYENTIRQTYEKMYDLASGLSLLMGCEPPSFEEAQGTPLADMAEDMVYHKFVWETWHYGRTEALVGEKLAEYWGVTDWVAESPELAEYGVENPEPRGIDLYFPEIDIRVQVKTGDGGAPKDCEADVIARYHEGPGRIDFRPLE